MKYEIKEKNGHNYIYLSANGARISTVQEGLDLMALCWEHEIGKLLIHGDRLADDFYILQTGLAGELLQKFTNYNISAAIVMDPEVQGLRFTELMRESKCGHTFSAFPSEAEATDWLFGNV